MARLILMSALAACTSTLSAYDATGPGAGDDATPTDGGGDADTDVDVDVDVDTDTDADTDPGAVTVVIDSVDPDFGTVDTEVALAGGPFTEPVTVTFAGVEANVLSVAQDLLVVEVPDAGGDGYVDVDVDTAEGATGSPGTFQFFQDARGGFGATGILQWNRYAGNYWADPPPVDEGFGQVVFPIGPGDSWQEFLYASGPDACELNYVGGNLNVYDPELSIIYVEANEGTRLGMPSVVGYEYIFEAFPVPANKMVVGSGYDLDIMTGNPDWPELTAPGLVGEIPGPFTITVPDVDQAVPPSTARNVVLSWAGPYTGDGVLAFLIRQRYTATGVTEVDSITCWLTDDGSHTVDGTLFTDWVPFTGATTYDAVYMQVGRFHEATGTLEHNQGAAGVLGASFQTGIALAQ